MNKNRIKRVIRAAKASKEREWHLVSYSIEKNALRAFKAACKRQGLKGSTVIEEFMREFVKVSK